MCIHICGGGLCMYECRCSQSPEEGPGSLEAGVTGSSELPSMSAMLNSGLLQELYMLITAEASLQTLDPILFIYLFAFWCLFVFLCMDVCGHRLLYISTTRCQSLPFHHVSDRLSLKLIQTSWMGFSPWESARITSVCAPWSGFSGFSVGSGLVLR